jgi:hypothetical protein
LCPGSGAGLPPVPEPLGLMEPPRLGLLGLMGQGVGLVNKCGITRSYQRKEMESPPDAQHERPGARG